MPHLKLEVGKGYMNGYGQYIKIVDKIQITDTRVAFYDRDHRPYEENGVVDNGDNYPDDHLNLQGEATVIPTAFYNQLIEESSPKRWRKVVVFCSSTTVFGLIVGIFNFFVVTHYCNL